MPDNNKPRIYAAIAITCGIGLIMGGIMAFLISSMTPQFMPLRVPASVQIGLGILATVSGVLFWRQIAAAKYIACVAAVGAVANIVFALTIFAKLVK